MVIPLLGVNKKMKTLSLKLPDELDAKLGVAANQNEISKSEMVRRALDAYLASEKPAAQGSFLELAADLIGCVEGPGDLSHNADYMDDFGK